MQFFKSKSLSNQLRPDEVNRLLQKDIGQRQLLPNKITEGARLVGNATVTFYANASAGDQYTAIDLDLETVPLAMVWHLGSIDKSGNKVGGSGLIAGMFYVRSSVVNGTSIFSGAQAAYSCTKEALEVGVTSTNVGYGGDFIEAYFRYAVFYDDTEVSILGI